MENELEKMRLRMAEMAAEIERQQSANEQCGKALKGEIILCDSLRAENARLQSIIDEANAQEPVAVQSNNGSVMASRDFCNIDDFVMACRNNTPLYAHPIPARQPQEVAVPSVEAFAAIIEKAVQLYSHKWSDEFCDVTIGIMKTGMGYIYPEGLIEFAKQIRSGEVELPRNLDKSPRITVQEFSDDEYICIRDAVDRLISAVGKDVDGDQSECSLCAEFIDELIKDVIVPLKIEWFENDDDCGYKHAVHRITEQDAREIAKALRDIVANYECGDDVDKKIISALNKLNAKQEESKEVNQNIGADNV